MARQRLSPHAIHRHTSKREIALETELREIKRELAAAKTARDGQYGFRPKPETKRQFAIKLARICHRAMGESGAHRPVCPHCGSLSPDDLEAAFLALFEGDVPTTNANGDA